MNNKGFTLLEVIAAIFLMTIGVIGILSLVNQTIISSQTTSSRLVASYLAQEGIEIVKNIRDTNFLQIHREIEGVEWDTGLTNCAGGCEADYNDLELTPTANRYLNIDAGFYQYSGFGTQTPFKRKITINIQDLSNPPDGSMLDKMKVQVEISWTERLRTYQVTAQENIYKWMQ